jgi:oxalate---CoA ligase
MISLCVKSLCTKFTLTVSTIRSLTESKYPLAFWVGYTEARLVCTTQIQSWAVVLSDRLILPLRWIDMQGNEIKDVWEAACRAVIGLVMMRPGISEVSISN